MYYSSQSNFENRSPTPSYTYSPSAGAGMSRRLSQGMSQSPYGYAAVQNAGGNVKSERVLNSTILKEEWVNGYPQQDQVSGRTITLKPRSM